MAGGFKANSVLNLGHVSFRHLRHCGKHVPFLLHCRNALTLGIKKNGIRLNMLNCKKKHLCSTAMCTCVFDYLAVGRPPPIWYHRFRCFRFKVKDMWIDRWKLKNIEKSCYLRLRHIDVTSCDSAGETVHANSWIVRLQQPIFASIVKPIPAYEAVQDCGTIHQVHLCSTWIVLTLTASSIETQKIPYVHIHSWFMTLCQASETQLLTKAS